MDYTIYYRRFHDGSQSDFDSAVAFYRRLLEPTLKTVSRDSRILDLGCGHGLLLNALQRLGFTNARGIDISREQVALGQSRGLACRAVDRDYLVSLATGTTAMFDLVFMMDVLEHMGKHEQVLTLSAVSKLLAQDGRLIVSVPNANSTLGLRWRYGDWTHEVSFTELSLDFLLLNTGFRDVNFLPYEFIARPRLPLIPRPSILPWAFQRIARILRRMEAVGELGANGWKIPLSLNLLVECRKDNA